MFWLLLIFIQLHLIYRESSVCFLSSSIHSLPLFHRRSSTTGAPQASTTMATAGLLPLTYLTSKTVLCRTPALKDIIRDTRQEQVQNKALCVWARFFPWILPLTTASILNVISIKKILSGFNYISSCPWQTIITTMII